jgi:hypothetical protein
MRHQHSTAKSHPSRTDGTPISKETHMTTSTALSPNWLENLLASLGSTGDEVAQTLRAEGATGITTDIWDDPVSACIRARTRDLVAPGSQVAVMVTTDDIAVIISDSPGPDARQEVLAATPGAIEDFIDRFDAGEDYQDLAR